jgi:hypothetical protein
MLATLVIASVACAALARWQPRWDGALAWILGGVLIALAGWRTGGFDYDEYIANIELTRSLSDEGFLAQLVAAKDPLFLLFIDVTGWLSDDPQWVIILVSVLAVASKVQASAMLARRRTYFIALYAVLLAPGLEFAAIRAGLGIGLILLAYASSSRWRAGWAALGIASHASVAVAVVGRLFGTHRLLALVLSVATIALIPTLLSMAGDDPRFSFYLENPGTMAAFAYPVMTLFALTALSNCVRFGERGHPLVGPSAIAASYFCVGMSLLLALPLVTVSFRLLEIAWVLMLAQLVAAGAIRLRGDGPLERQAAWLILLATLVLENLGRDTWRVLAHA